MARAFSAIRANVEKRLRQEQRQLDAFAAGFQQKALSDVPDDHLFWGLQREEFLREVGDETQTLLQAGIDQASRLGLAVNFDLANQSVLDLAGDFTNAWWDSIARTTQQQLRTAIQNHIRAETSFSQLTKSLEPTFGKTRAEMVASTEVTRLYAEGNRAAYASAGITTVEWRTVFDSQVDPICEDLAGQRQPLGQEQNVPPAHVRCRCWLAPVVGDTSVTEPIREPIEDVAHTWSESVGNSHAIQDASRELMENTNLPLTTLERQRAAQLMEAIQKAPKVDRLYRGMEVSKDAAKQLQRFDAAHAKRWGLEPSGEFKLPISSFTSDRSVAAEFASLGIDEVSVMIELRNARGLDISKWVLEDFRDQAEHLVSGVFRVVESRMIGGGGRLPNRLQLVLEVT